MVKNPSYSTLVDTTIEKKKQTKKTQSTKNIKIIEWSIKRFPDIMVTCECACACSNLETSWISWHSRLTRMCACIHSQRCVRLVNTHNRSIYCWIVICHNIFNFIHYNNKCDMIYWSRNGRIRMCAWHGIGRFW